MPASQGQYDLLRPRLSRFTRALQHVPSGQPAAVHRTRVASRRLREILPVLQLKASQVQKVSKRLRKVTRRLGHVRELDVLLMVIEELHESRPDVQAALIRVANQLRERRKEVWTSISGKDAVTERDRVTKGLKGLLREIERKPVTKNEKAWKWAIDARVARRTAGLGKAIDEAGAMYFPERLHVVRIALKKLRYAVELRAEASGATRSAELTALTRAQSLLGRLHDLQVFIEHVRRFQASLAPADLAVWRDLDLLINSIERTCRRLHARYVRERTPLVALCQKLSKSSSRYAMRKAG